MTQSGGFALDWLRLREPYDTEARAVAASALSLPQRLAGWCRAVGGSPAVLDLGCGSGANLRALAPQLGRDQRWRLVDHDLALLAALPDEMAAWAKRHGHRFDAEALGGWRLAGDGFDARLQTESLNLAGSPDAWPIEPRSLITASALLDLASASWLDALLAQAVAARCALLFVLDVDGRQHWSPPDEDDAPVQAAFVAHQRRDKGLGGPALGPDAGAHAVARLSAAGYQVAQAASDWRVDRAHGGAAMLQAMAEGLAGAAAEQSLSLAVRAAAWRQRRSEQADVLRVGHVDLWAAP